MSANTKIEWCDHTFNPWIGCTKVSPGCANCYAEAYDKRWGGSHWGKGAPRKRTSAANWNQPLKWHREEEAKRVSHAEFVSNRRPRVFCASLADWLDDEVPAAWLFDLLTLIHKTPNLDWLLLTKRPENWRSRLRAVAGQCTVDPLDITDRIYAWLEGSRIWSNIWIGTTVEDQHRADERIPALLKIPARIRFLSCEPLLGPVDLESIEFGNNTRQTCLTPTFMGNGLDAQIDWVICGGESGPNARPMHPVWARGLRDQCAATDTPFFFKQWGDWKPLFAEADLAIDGKTIFHKGDFTVHWKQGKKAAGRLLDGREHNEFPA